MPNMKIFTYQRLDWLKRASTLPSSADEFLMDSSKEHDFHISNKSRFGLLGAVDADKVAVIELLFPSVFRAIISLHPAGSMDPDAVAFFSPDEVILFTCCTIFIILSPGSLLKHFAISVFVLSIYKFILLLHMAS